MPKRNYHTHTTRCQHASGSDEAFVQAAISAGYDTLGFSDHAPWPFKSGHVSGIRMTVDQWPEYKQSILTLKKRYDGVIRVRLGLEIEYFPRYRDHMLRLLDDGCEYFILGQHAISSEEDNPYITKECAADDGVRRFADSVAEGLSTGMFSCVAHPDMYMCPRHGFDQVCMDAADTICQAAREYHVPLEYNLLGLLSELEGHPRGYPCADFWQHVRKWGNDVILGVDAHSPLHLTNEDTWQTALDRLHALGHHVIDSI